MAWKIELDDGARRELDRLDYHAAQRILAFLRDRVARADNPRTIDRAFRGTRTGSLGRCRAGGQRIVVAIEDQASRILVLRLGHQRDIYRQLVWRIDTQSSKIITHPNKSGW